MTTRGNKPNHQKEIAKLLSGDPILFHPALVKVAGSINCALILSQILFWQGLGRWGDLVYKTLEELEEETGLTRSQQDTAIKMLVADRLLEVRRLGAYGRRHFKVNIPRLTGKILGMQESSKLDKPKPVNQFVENRQTITETTAEITTDINSKGLDKLKDIKNAYSFR